MQQDEVEVLVNKLPASMQKDISTDTIVKTQEQLRLLKQKVPTGKLLRNVDKPELRAACMLEHVCRKEAGIRLCQKTISKSLGARAGNFKNLHKLIGNFFEEPQLHAVSRRVNPRRNSPQATTQTVALDQPEESIIPRLSIRLNSLINDPNGFALKALTLFDDIVDYVDGLKNPRKKDQQNDMQRFRAAYEAACLYYVVSKTQSKNLSRISKSQKISEQQQQVNPMARQEDDPHRTLEISDIIDASPDFTVTDFKAVVKHLQSLAVEMEESKANIARNVSKSKAVSKKSSGGRKGSTKATTTQGKSKKRSVGAGAAEEIFSKQAKTSRASNESALTSSDDENEVQEGIRGKEERLFDVDIPSLYEWREQTLDNACQAVRQKLDKPSPDPKEIRRSLLLETAADAVLAKFGIL